MTEHGAAWRCAHGFRRERRWGGGGGGAGAPPLLLLGMAAAARQCERCSVTRHNARGAARAPRARRASRAIHPDHALAAPTAHLDPMVARHGADLNSTSRSPQNTPRASGAGALCGRLSTLPPSIRRVAGPSRARISIGQGISGDGRISRGTTTLRVGWALLMAAHLPLRYHRHFLRLAQVAPDSLREPRRAGTVYAWFVVTVRRHPGHHLP